MPEKLDLFKYLNHYSFDTIMDSALGIDANSQLESAEFYTNLLAQFNRVKWLLQYRANKPLFWSDFIYRV